VGIADRMLRMMFRSAISAMFLTGTPWAAGLNLTFEKDVRPILKANCFHCHGEEGETQGGLDVRLARFLQKGGESGPAIVPGDVAKSHLMDLVKAGEMPKGKTKLKASDIAEPLTKGDIVQIGGINWTVQRLIDQDGLTISYLVRRS